MAIQTVSQFPWPPLIAASTVNNTSFTLDAGTDKVALVFQAPKAGDLDRVEILLGAITTWPTNGVSMGWQGLTETSTPSIPNGTYTHSVTVTSAPTAEAWWNPGSFVDGGSAKRTVTKGEYVCFVMEMANTGDSTNFALPRIDLAGNAFDPTSGFPYTLLRATSAYALVYDMPYMALFYVGDTHPTPIVPWIVPQTTVATFGTTLSISTSNPQYAGMLFTPPFTCRVTGMWAHVDTDILSTFGICTTDATSPLASVTTGDKDRRATAGAGYETRFFTSSVTLTAGTAYRIFITNTTSATANALRYAVLPSGTPDYGAAWPAGATAKLTQSDDGTTWTDTPDTMPFMGLLIDGLDDGGPTNDQIAAAVWAYESRTLTG